MHLKRSLGFWDSVAINVGGIIGVGIFRTQGAIAQYVDSAPLILLTWLIGAFIALLGVLCYAELSSCHPHTGGTYIYIREAYGRPMGFIFGWSEFMILRAGSVAGVAYILVAYIKNFLPEFLQHERMLTIGMIMLFTYLNIVGLHVGTGVQNALTLLKLVSILAMAAIIFTVKGLPGPELVSFGGIHSKAWMGIAAALIPVLWTYGGWHQSTFMSGEFKDTKRALPFSLVAGIMIVAAIYVIINAAYLQVFTPGQMAQTKAIASDIFGQLYGKTGQSLVSLAVIISASGALNSTILTGARIPFAVAHDYPKMNWLTALHPKYQTPLRSYVLNGIWASVLVLWGNFEQLLFFFSFVNWLFFGMVGISVFLLRKKHPKAAGYSMIGYPWVPILFTILAFAMCGITIQSTPRESAFGALLLMTGFPVYGFFRGKKTS
jgi:basic amino acid/polyamine antiporter, APA family